MNASPVTEQDLVPLDPDHPGFRDPVYRARRNAIAKLAFTAKEGEPAPVVDYTDEENQVWRTVWESLGPLQEKWASREFLDCFSKLNMDRTRIPQLVDMNEKLGPLTGWQMIPVGGLVSARTFFAYLAKKRFLSTQYIRHKSVPLYTPEPDVVHELVGHAGLLANPTYSQLNQMAGQAADGLDDDQLKRLERVYWYTLEFGVVKEKGELKAFGAGLLSSFGELSEFAKAKLRPMVLEEIAQTPYDPTRYQETLFVADSVEHMRNTLTDWFTGSKR